MQKKTEYTKMQNVVKHIAIQERKLAPTYGIQMERQEGYLER